MDHVAIMNKSWNLIPKILSGEKTIESRWYKHRTSPWGRISKGDVVYFKDSGCPVTAKAEVEKVLQFESYSVDELRCLIDTYGGKGKIDFVYSSEAVFDWAKDKNHSILIFLINAEKVAPFEINKKGFGNACAWLCVGDIERVRLVF